MSDYELLTVVFYGMKLLYFITFREGRVPNEAKNGGFLIGSCKPVN